MYRKYMTEEQLRKLKHTQWCHFHNGIRVERLYPQVEQIEIHYEKRHISFLGETHQEGTRVIKPDSEAFFIIECLNRECSSIGYNLGNVISSAIHGRKTEISGEMKCEGQEAHDHPEQSCSGTIKFTINIYYK